MEACTELLSRDDFRERVFQRDSHRCVMCTEPAQDAHHIIERRLWPDGGYYMDNGASLCGKHHIEAEQTILSVETIREAAGIESVHVPPHLYSDTVMDKWGNPILPNGNRMVGELFYDESVQKILNAGGVLPLFTHWVKYPRTHHVPWSQSIQSDDRVIDSMDAFMGKRVIVTEKMDGENTTMYQDYFHARSVDGRSHPSRSWAKSLWGRVCGDIPEKWRICGENLYAEHSIAYDSLETYFMGFSIWDDVNTSLSWDDTVEWFKLLGIQHVPVLFDGIYNEKTIQSLWTQKDWSTREGYVLRVADAIPYSSFRTHYAKFVRKGHVATSKHWMHGKWTKNRLQKA